MGKYRLLALSPEGSSDYQWKLQQRFLYLFWITIYEGSREMCLVLMEKKCTQ